MRARRIALLAALALVACHSTAHADDYYVDDGASAAGDCSQAMPCQVITDALVLAADNTPGSLDTIHVAPGNYTSFALPTGPDYNQIVVEGSGTADDPATGTRILPDGMATPLIDVGGPDQVTLRGMRLVHPQPPGADPDRNAIRSAGGNVTIEDVFVDVRRVTASDAVLVTNGPFTLNRVTVTTVGGNGDAVELQEGTGTATVSDSTLAGTDAGSGRALGVDRGVTTTVVRSRLSTASTDPVIEATVATLKLDSSLVTGGNPAVVVNAFSFDAHAEIRSSTIDAGGANSILANAFGNGANADVALKDSIAVESVSAFAVISDTGNSATIVCTNSDTPSVQVNDPKATIDCDAVPGNNTHTPPGDLFLNHAGGDYRLKAGASAIDTGANVPLGTLDPLDLAGNDRIRDGNGDGSEIRDKGAFEYQRLPPVVSAHAADTAAVGEALLFTSSATDPDPGDAVTFQWAFDDGGTGSGPNAAHSFSTPGAHTATVTVTDSAGATASVTLTIQVTAPSGPGPGGGGPGGGGPGPGGATAADDNLLGDALANLICGLAGSDVIDGGPGDDTLFGDQCNENARIQVGAAAVGDGNDTLIGNAGNDTLVGSGGNDRLSGNAGNDRLRGGSGRDRLDGDTGNDRLEGDGQNDTLNGGTGNDRLTGGRGRNRYSGGAGNDTVNAANRIRETVNCGSGRRDRATVDRNDRVRGCERVTRRR